MTSKFALVIANTEYQDASFAKLTAPGKDAEEFARVLRNPELAAFEDVQILLNEGESKIRRSIARFFSDRKRDDLLLLYFSGHGIRNEQGQLFLAANDTEIKILEATGIPADFITYAMNNSRSQRQLLILDCCNSGAFAYGSKSTTAIGKSMGIATAFEGSGFGRVVLTATDATQFAWEGDKVIGDTQKSVFTHFLIEGLKGNADQNGDGRIDVDELYDFAYEQVVRQTPKQTPGKWSYKQQGDILLCDNLKPRDVKPSPLPPGVLDLLSHPNPSVRGLGIQDLIKLLNGQHLGLARGAEEKLREIAINDDSYGLRKTAGEALVARGLIPEQPIETPKVDVPVAKPTPIEVLKKERKKEEKIEKSASIIAIPRTEENGKEKKPHLSPETKRVVLNPRLIGGIAGGLLLVTLLIWGGSLIVNNMLGASISPTSILSRDLFATSTNQSDAMAGIAALATGTALAQTSITPTSDLGIGSQIISEKDGMTLLNVPAGEFTMGSETGDNDEKPTHSVYLDAYWIDHTEVTNAMYAKCVANGGCNPPISTKSYTRDSYYGNAEFDNYPVIYVDWDMAKAYCEWVDRRLPTEAEWEKAARDTDGRTYPWGEGIDSTRANYNKNVGDTTEVGKYPNDASPYGALNLAGNVWEWVADWYDPNYYATLEAKVSNPQGPASGSLRVLRGGSWVNRDDHVRSADRGWFEPEDFYYAGFRCAMSDDR